MIEYAPIKTWIAVQSSNLHSVWYDPEQQILKIAFMPEGSGVSYYGYSGVPMSVFLALLAAPSKGKYHHKHIKGQYPYTRLGYGGA